MKKILWLSDLVAPTGFARVSHSVIKYLDKTKFNVTGIGVNYYGDPHHFDFPIYPAMTPSTANDIYGFARINQLVSEKFDAIFIINDAWVIKEYLKVIKDVYKDKPLPKIVTYIPVDAEDHDFEWYQDFDMVSCIVAYTEFGKKVLQAASGRNDIKVIPHGIDTSLFNKIPEDKINIKKKIYGDNASYYDSFIVLSASRNQPRKRLDITMEGFKLFVEGKPENVKLYMHCGVRDSHLDIEKLAVRLNLSKNIILTSKTIGIQTVHDGMLNLIYNATDVGINTSLGEGFSLTNIEHAVTGSPQVVANHSSLTEIYQDCGILVPTSQSLLLDHIMTKGYLVKPEDVAASLDKLYKDRLLYKQLSNKCIMKFTNPYYSWKNISKLWEQTFEEVLKC